VSPLTLFAFPTMKDIVAIVDMEEIELKDLVEILN
jgi:hypothetical protein